MAEVDDEIAVVGNDGVVENDPSNTPPIFERAPLKDRQPARRALVGHFNVEGERALGLGIALVENLRHDLVAKVQRLAFDPRLLRRDQKALELRRPRPFALRFADLDRKSTRLNSSHTVISYAVFCLKKKKKSNTQASCAT